MGTLARPGLLVGKRIVAVDLRRFEDRTDSGRLIKICYDPIITLDSGARVTFVVQETDSGDHYGIEPIYHPKDKR